jgi:hypothetical protein
MRSHFILVPIICVALAFAGIARSTEAKSAKLQSGEINVAPIEDIARELHQMWQSGQLDLGHDYGVMASFRILTDGSIPKESIRILHSSGSKLIDTKTLELLWRLGESQALGALASLSSNILEVRVSDTAAKLSITSFAQTAKEARFKVSQLSFLLKLVGVQQRSKNPMVSELLSHLVLKAEGVPR